jgi:hypothetical protein
MKKSQHLPVSLRKMVIPLHISQFVKAGKVCSSAPAGEECNK